MDAITSLARFPRKHDKQEFQMILLCEMVVN